LYLRDLARQLNVPYKVAYRDVWKVINLGIANIAYDLKNDIVFIPGAVKTNSNSVTVKNVETPRIIETEVKEEIPEGDLQCAFCDAMNPNDSMFCIKCGASMQPAK